MRTSLLFLSLLFALYSCGKTHEPEATSQPASEDFSLSLKDSLTALPEEELIATDADFGEITPLKGTSQPVDQMFTVRESEFIVLDSLFIMKNQTTSNIFMAFSLPDFRFIKSFGKLGRGPGEFQYPALAKDDSGEFLCFIYERVTNDLFGVTEDLEIIKLPLELKKSKQTFNEKQLCGFSPSEFLYVESTRNGKALFHAKMEDDSTHTTLLKTISLPDQEQNWMINTGSFGVNRKKHRAVYAFKYFKRLLFFDLDHHTSRTVIFDDVAAEQNNRQSPMSPENITHYWGLSAGDEYVYALYSGRPPVDVSRELDESHGYIFVEKFDWNGNPVSKFKLDHWGYFSVNEPEALIYLASNTEEQPLISYTLPKD